jgi:uncharacterized protein (DUF4415 family)
MKTEKSSKYTTNDLKNMEKFNEDRTDWSRVLSMKDEDIIIDEDSPEMTQDMFENQRIKTRINIYLDSDVIKWYEKQNIAYQPLINSLLRSYMEAHH